MALCINYNMLITTNAQIDGMIFVSAVFLIIVSLLKKIGLSENTRSISSMFLFISLITSLTYMLKINSGLFSDQCSGLPNWFDSWWVICECLFCISILSFLIYLFIQIDSGYLNFIHQNSPNDRFIMKSRYINIMCLIVVIIASTINLILYFALCDPGSC